MMNKMKKRMGCMKSGGVVAKDDQYAAGGKVVDEEAGAKRRESEQIHGTPGRSHLGRGVRGKFAMGGVVKHPTERCE